MRTTGLQSLAMSGSPIGLTTPLTEALSGRRIEEGFELLEQVAVGLGEFRPEDARAAHFVLCLAEWVDAGYSDHRLIEMLLQRFSAEQRRKLPISEYLLLRMAEAFACIAK
jgi:hypothetical protein